MRFSAIVLLSLVAMAASRDFGRSGPDGQEDPRIANREMRNLAASRGFGIPEVPDHQDPDLRLRKYNVPRISDHSRDPRYEGPSSDNLKNDEQREAIVTATSKTDKADTKALTEADNIQQKAEEAAVAAYVAADKIWEAANNAFKSAKDAAVLAQKVHTDAINAVGKAKAGQLYHEKHVKYQQHVANSNGLQEAAAKALEDARKQVKAAEEASSTTKAFGGEVADAKSNWNNYVPGKKPITDELITDESVTDESITDMDEEIPEQQLMQ